MKNEQPVMRYSFSILNDALENFKSGFMFNF